MGLKSVQRRHPVLFSLTAVILIVTGVTVAVTGPTIILWYARTRLLALRPTSTSFDKWADSQITISAYIFNVTNPHDVVKNGSKPVVQEIGPFVYTAKQKKVNISFRSDEEVEYEKTYKVSFEAEKSVGDEETEMYVLNPEMAGFLYKYRSEPPNMFIKSKAKFAFRKDKLKGLFVKRTAKQLLHGHRGVLLTALFQTVTPSFLVPGNNSVYPQSVIHTGKGDFQRLNHLLAYDNHTEFPYWTGDKCRKYPKDLRAEPNIGSDLEDDVNTVRLFMFWSRAMDWFKQATRVTHAVHGYDLEVNRFTPDPHFYDNGVDQQANACFDSRLVSPEGFNSSTNQTTNETISSSSLTGMPSGVFDMSPIKNQPVLMSYPHFMHGDDYFQDRIDGLEPNASVHSPEWLIQPDTGVMVRFKNQFQVNLLLLPVHRKIGLGFDNAPSIIYPMLWMEHETVLPESAAKKIHLATKMSYPLSLAFGALLSTAGLVLLVLVLISCSRAKRKAKFSDPIVKYPDVKAQILPKANLTTITHDHVTDIPGPETDIH